MGRVGKKVVNLTQPDTPFIKCAWDDCWKDGVELHKVRIRYGNQGYGVFHVFCSERHRQMFINGHRSYGNLPAGMRGIIL